MTLAIAVVWLHFIGDFLFQTDKMATGKSKSVKWLTLHVLAYSVPLFLLGWKYALLNAGIHFVVDFFTSRATSFLYAKNERHWFFVVIGLDQAIHLTCLLWLLKFVQPLF